MILIVGFSACNTSGSREVQMNTESAIGEDQDKTTVDPDTVSTTDLTTGSDSVNPKPSGGTPTQ